MVFSSLSCRLEVILPASRKSASVIWLIRPLLLMTSIAGFGREIPRFLPLMPGSTLGVYLGRFAARTRLQSRIVRSQFFWSTQMVAKATFLLFSIGLNSLEGQRSSQPLNPSNKASNEMLNIDDGRFNAANVHINAAMTLRVAMGTEL